MPGGPDLQRRAVLREGRAEEGTDGIKHHIYDVFFQDGISQALLSFIADLHKQRKELKHTLVVCLRGQLHAVDGYPSHVHCEVFKELPDVVGRVDLFHLHLCVHIAVINKVDVGHLHLEQTQIQMKTPATCPREEEEEEEGQGQCLSDAVLMGDHPDHVLQGQQRSAFDLSVDVFALSTGG